MIYHRGAACAATSPFSIVAGLLRRSIRASTRRREAKRFCRRLERTGARASPGRDHETDALLDLLALREMARDLFEAQRLLRRFEHAHDNDGLFQFLSGRERWLHLPQIVLEE